MIVSFTHRRFTSRACVFVNDGEPDSPIYLSHWIAGSLFWILIRHVQAVVRSATDLASLRRIHPGCSDRRPWRVGYTISTVEQLTRSRRHAASDSSRMRPAPRSGFAFTTRATCRLPGSPSSTSPVRSRRTLAWSPRASGRRRDLARSRRRSTACRLRAPRSTGSRRTSPSGDTYQANYTFRVEGLFSGDPGSCLRDLVRLQRRQYSAFIEPASWRSARRRRSCSFVARAGSRRGR